MSVLLERYFSDPELAPLIRDGRLEAVQESLRERIESDPAEQE